MNVELGSRTGYLVELRTNKSLTSGMKQKDIAEMRKGPGRRDEWGEVRNDLDNI